jgi:PAS domain S-box-containing protein
MKDSQKGNNKTKEQLLQEIAALRQLVAELENLQSEHEQLSKKYRITLESISDGLVSFDKQWRYTYINDSAQNLLQKPREELLGKTPWEAFPDSPHLKFYTEFTRSCDQNVPVHFEEFYPSPLNRWFECHCYPGTEGLSVYFQDITKRKEAEEMLQKTRDNLEKCVLERTAELQKMHDALEAELAERKRVEEQLQQAQKMEALGTFAGGIAHDFNNILAAILGFTEMVMEDVADNPGAQRSLGYIHKSVIRAKELVKQILTFSRKTEYERNPLSVSPIIKETARLLRAFFPTSINIIPTTEATSDTVLASPLEIQQILMNLGANAAHAMEEKGNTLEIGLTDIVFPPGSLAIPPGLIPGEYLQLTVQDNGVGMSPEVKVKIFEPFFTTRRAGKGTGMGLSVVYGIVKNLHGAITVESELGVGSTFRVYIPKIEDTAITEGTAKNDTPRGAEKILFIDDEEFLTDWGKAALERLGYKVTAMNNSTEALNIFLSNPSQFDLVITDQTMPGVTGVQLSKRILEVRPDIPIVLCTGYSDHVSPEASSQIGIRQFLMNPSTRQELAQTIRNILDEKRDRS